MKRVVFMIIPALVCVMVFTSCGSESESDDFWANSPDELFEHNRNKISISEGISGTVLRALGRENKQYPIKQEIFIYEYITSDEVKHLVHSHDEFYEAISSKFITSLTSDKEGFFEFELKPGKYSLIIKDKPYGWVPDEQEEGLCPVLVYPNKVSEKILRVTL